MKFKRVTYFALAAFISVASCTKEATEPNVYDWADGNIYFKTSLADVASSRAQDMTLDGLESFQVTCFNTGDFTKDETGYISPYFENATFIRNDNPTGTTYGSSPYEEPREWPSGGGIIKFFAFSPSLNIMGVDNSALNDANRQEYFNLENRSTTTNSTVTTDYRLGKLRVNPDISRQFDFVTAMAAGERWKDFNNTVELAFSHQMCQVELNAWGAGSGYDFEIAGVRIGNPVVEGRFVFADASDQTKLPHWESDKNAVMDKVEYLYHDPAENQIALIGDTIFLINKDNHNTLESASSIMGRGGCAMVIPTVNSKWEGLADPNIDEIPYSTDRMYFSILMRVTNSANGKQLYPYPDNADGLTVIHYAVDKAGAIIARVYPGVKDGEFFTDSNLRNPYAAQDGVEIKEFGWAAVPVDANWGAGKRYVYTLNYSEGIGVHDPEDPKPGTPIQGKAVITWGVSVGNWDEAKQDADYNPDIVVP